MIDISSEDLIDLRIACREPVFRSRGGQPCHVSSLYRHILRGARDANGGRVKLEIVRTPSGLKTSRQAIERFIRQLTDPTAPLPQTKARRSRQEAAERELRDAGFELSVP
jgi:hypothetical protein